MKDKKKKSKPTELSECDKKVLDKYTKSYTNFIESSSVKKKSPDTEINKLLPKEHIHYLQPHRR